ncbi:hypothetical protein Clacol_006475 [Clathrus columnatus]|uniref:Uncharacterized protein n=1 Tax=Clathrus columnatus TaxID=1419009 RepID=A0AAV5AHS8_9AGAM|nr:hypothetical protein Clacol_006475 [Clathrus columnatus]
MDVFITDQDVDQMPFLDRTTSSSSRPGTNPTPVFDPDGDGDDDSGSSFTDSDSDGPDITLNPQIPQPSHVPKSPISLPLMNKTAITSGQLTLPALTVPPGWYVFAAKGDFTVAINPNGNLSEGVSNAGNSTQAHLIIRSTPFFVTDGGNTSCVPPSLLQIAQQNQVNHIPTLPLSPSALAGTIVGCIVGVIVLVGACILPRIWRRGFPGHKAWEFFTDV